MYSHDIRPKVLSLLKANFKLFQHYLYNKFIEDVEYVCKSGVATKHAAVDQTDTEGGDGDRDSGWTLKTSLRCLKTS